MTQKLDQFYTKPDIARMCWEKLYTVLCDLYDNIENLTYLEPSAGKGSFFSLMPEDRRIGFDIYPKYKDIKKTNFFSEIDIISDVENTIVVGNPPFGKRGKTAIKFFNHACGFGLTIAFIVPVIFKKFAVHKQLYGSMKLISRLNLPYEAFELDNRDVYGANCEFQIWTQLNCKYEDMREYIPRPTKHKDFQIWQYNNTGQALKVFDNDFDFAVPCQGYQAYNRKEFDKNRCEKTKQWMLFKANDEETLQRLLDIDYIELSTKNATIVPGFRMGDLVKEYCDRYEEEI